MPYSQEHIKKVARYNATVMVMEGSLFVLTISLLDASSVVSVFLNAVMGTAVWSGVASAIAFLFPLLGTLYMGRRIAALKNQQRTMAIMSFFLRPTFIFIVLALIFDLPPVTLGIIFLFCYALYYFGEGNINLLWTEILVRTQPLENRVAITSRQRIYGGIVGLLGAEIIRRTLSSQMALNAKFILIFSLALASCVINAILLYLIRDLPPEDERPKTSPGWGVYLRSFMPLFTQEKEVRQTIGAKAFFQMAMMSAPLNILYCINHGNITHNQAGMLMYMPVIGSILGGMFWTWYSRRFGYPRVIVATMCVMVLSAVCTLAALALAPGGANVFVLMGLAMIFMSFNLGAHHAYNHHVISIVPQRDRAQYFVLLSLLVAPFTLSSILAGTITDVFGYLPAYLLQAIVAVGGLFYALRFYKTRNSAKEGYVLPS
ncbi:MAG: MFS transporter [Christensenellales bacterium]|jgi:hypothetical protein